MNNRQPGAHSIEQPVRTERRLTSKTPMRHSFVADWLLPGAIAAVVSGQTTLCWPSRESEKRGNRGSSRFLLRSRRDIKFRGACPCPA